ncbi:NHLP bacteriocin system secretion protein [Kamptonema formosum]|uniref:NHLP bacteriocin system secretion protein n=1 Tax=Kamptonema formosum TaxID=331992 RepID=UPI00034C3C2E|nr:NHLP bacteriocin system secretion protein [Oscillatoria sp. PCC 10802]
MQEKGRKIFREEALEQLSSPEQLDRLMRAVSPQTWLPLAATGFLVVAAGIWSVVGRIPLTVSGVGVLVRPRNVVQFQTPSAGQVLNISVKAGDSVKKGEVLATIDQSQLKQELQQERAKLAELQQQKKNAGTLEQQQVALERRNIEQQRRDLQKSLQREAVAPVVREKTLAALEQKRKSLQESLRREQIAPALRQQTLAALEQRRKSLQESLRREQVAPNLRQENLAALAEKRKSLQLQKEQITSLLATRQQRVETRRRLFQEKLVSQDIMLQAEEELFSAQRQLADLEAQLKELDVQETNVERDYLQNLNRIDDIKNSLQQIDLEVANTERDYLQSQNRMDDIKTSLQQIDVDVASAEREYLQSLNKIDQIKTQIKDLDAQEAKLNRETLEKQNDATNEIQQVKRRIEQLELQLTKESKIVSPYDGQILELSAVAGQIVSAGTRIGAMEAEEANAKLESLVYFADRDGKQIKSGMPVQVTPSVVQRERYGGIVGVVTKVSPFPVTVQDITAIVGNEELARSLASDSGARVQVFVRLQEDSSTTSGYKWSSSKGPSLKISSGTTAQVRVKVEEVAPISYIIPILRSWSGIY